LIYFIISKKLLKLLKKPRDVLKIENEKIEYSSVSICSVPKYFIINIERILEDRKGKIILG
jgi:hypothetical protein